MKKILIIIPLIVIIGIFANGGRMTTFRQGLVLDSTKIQQSSEDINWWRIMSREEKIKWLDSMNALGVGIIIRGADSTYDTIIGHFQYFYTTDK